MKNATELRIIRTSAGFIVKAKFPPLSRTVGMLDLSHRKDLTGSEVQLSGPFRTREEAARSMEKLRVRSEQ